MDRSAVAPPEGSPGPIPASTLPNKHKPQPRRRYPNASVLPPPFYNERDVRPAPSRPAAPSTRRCRPSLAARVREHYERQALPPRIRKCDCSGGSSAQQSADLLDNCPFGGQTAAGDSERFSAQHRVERCASGAVAIEPRKHRVVVEPQVLAEHVLRDVELFPEHCVGGHHRARTRARDPVPLG